MLDRLRHELDRLRHEPAVLIIVAAAVIVLGVDLAAVTGTVEQVIQLAALAASAWGIRARVTPVVDPHDDLGRPLVPDV